MDRVLFDLGLLLLWAGQESEARGYWHRLEQRYPQSPYSYSIRVLLGDYYFDRDAFELAHRAYETAIGLDKDGRNPLYSYVLYRDAWTYYRQANYQRAVESLRLVIDATSRPTGGTQPRAAGLQLLEKVSKALSKVAQEDLGAFQLRLAAQRAPAKK